MSSLMRWNPERRFLSMARAMDRFFDDGWMHSTLAPFSQEGGMSLEMYETENDVVIKADIPGVKPEDIQINVVGDLLTIKGETRSDSEENDKERNYYYREHRYGHFSRAVSLPTAINVEETKAEFENGVLTLTAPKAEAAKRHTIEVKNKQEKSEQQPEHA